MWFIKSFLFYAALLAALAVIIAIISAYVVGVRGAGYTDGYIQCLNDMKNGVPPQYQLVVQKNGESRWEMKKY